MSVLRVKNGDQWDIVPAIKGDTGDPAADESITDAMLVPDGIKTEIDWLWGNQLMDIREGELLQTDDAYEGPLVSLDVDGKSTQDDTPTPENPVPIVSVDAPTVTLAGKNLCPTADGTIIASDWIREGQNYFKYIGLTVENATLTLSCNMAAAPSVISTSNNRLYVTIPGAQSKFCDLNTAGAKSVTVSGSGIVRMGINRNAIDSNGVDTLLKDIQLELGPTATAYQPYLGHTVPLLPDGYSLRSLPDGTKDELHLSYLRPSTHEGWAWYDRELVQRIDTHTFNGSETWTGGTIEAYNGATGTNRFNSQITDLRRATQVPMRDCLLSDVLMHTSVNIWSTPDNYIWYTVANDNQIHIVFDNETIGVTAETAQAERTTAIRAWLAENPITIYYPLATPITTQLDPIELPIMPSKDTTIWSDPSAQLKMTYIQDTNLVIQSLEATVADMATS